VVNCNIKDRCELHGNTGIPIRLKIFIGKEIKSYVVSFASLANAEIVLQTELCRKQSHSRMKRRTGIDDVDSSQAGK